MDEVKKYCEQFKPFVTEKEYKLLEQILGIAEQEGLYIEIEGIGKIDKYIAPYIKKLNDIGLTTLACCSGLQEDHPETKVSSGYISFLYSDQTKHTIQPIAKTLNLQYGEGECYLQPSITVYFKASSDELQKQIINEFFKLTQKDIQASE